MRISGADKLKGAIGALVLGLIILGAWWERRVLPSLVVLFSEDVQHFVSKTLFYVGGQPVRIWFVIKTILYLAFLALLSRFAGYLIRRIARNNADIGEHRQYFLSRLGSFFIYVVGILIGIDVERIPLNTLVILGGTLGVGIGFGLQSLVSNLIAGLILFIEQPIRIGDMIEFGNKAGQVVRIGTRCSWIKTSDNAHIMIPNSEFTTKDILNWTVSDPRIRVSIPVSVAHGSDIPKVMRVLLNVAGQHADVLKTPASQVILAELGQNAITFTLRVWTIKGINDFAKLRSDMYLQIVQSFEEEKIILPFPQLDVHWTPNKTLLAE